MRPRTLSSAALLFLFWPGAVRGIDFDFPWLDIPSSFEITETLFLDYHDNNFNGDPWDDRYGDVRNRLNLKLAVREFTFSVRVDTLTFIQPPEAPQDANRLPYIDRYAPEKITGNYEGKNFQITLGDYYATFGRGMALEIRKIDELAQDTTLLGAKGSFQAGGFDVTALSGFANPTNIDPSFEKLIADTYDWISGLRTTYRFSESVVTGLHGVVVLFDPFSVNDQMAAQQLTKRAYVAGATLEVPDLVGLANLYAEFDWMGSQRPDPVDPSALLDSSNSWAGYFSGNLALEDFSLQAEFKYYNKFSLYVYPPSDDNRYRSDLRIDYIHPPTLEQEDMEVMNNEDIWGGRFQASWHPWGADTIVSASYAAFRATDSNGLPRFIYNTHVGAEQGFLGTGKAKIDAGLREERPQYPPGVVGVNIKHLIYLYGSVKVPISTHHSIEFHGFHWWVHELRPDGDYLKGDWSLAYNWAPYLSLGAILGYDTEPSGVQDLAVFYDTGNGHVLRQVFLAGNATVNLLSSRLVFKLTVGQMRGGLKCIGGSCANFPPFAGVRLETVVRF